MWLYHVLHWVQVIDWLLLPWCVWVCVCVCGRPPINTCCIIYILYTYIRCIHTLNHWYMMYAYISPLNYIIFLTDSKDWSIFCMSKKPPQGAEKRGMVRCPRHNKTFDLATGESPGNCEILQTSPGILKNLRFLCSKVKCSRIGATTGQTMNCLMCHRFDSTSSGLYSPTVKRVKIEVWGISQQKSHNRT